MLPRRRAQARRVGEEWITARRCRHPGVIRVHRSSSVPALQVGRREADAEDLLAKRDMAPLVGASEK